MLVKDYTLPQLVDLALRVPEIGAVNFNILHTVLQSMIEEMNLRVVKPWCHIENPVVAKAALTNAKLKAPPLKRSFSADDKLHPTSKSRPVTPSQLGPGHEEKLDTREVVTEEEEDVFDADEDETGLEVPEESDSEDEEDEGGEHDEDKTAESSSGTRKKPLERTRLPSIGENIVEMIGQAKESEMMTEMWRATNVNRRMEAAEEGLEKLSFVVDRIADRLNEMTDSSNDTQVVVETIKPQITTLTDEVESLKESTTTKQEFDTVKTRTDIIEEIKTDKEDVLKIIEEKLASGKDEEFEDLRQKVTDLEETVHYILDFLGLPFVPSSQRQEGEEEEEPVMPLNDRFDEVWKEMENLMTKAKSSGGGVDSKKFDDQERLIKSLADQVETVKNKVEMFENEARRKEKIVEVLQNDVNDLQFSKAEKEELSNGLDMKADKKDLELKVDREEFLATVEDLGEAIEGLVEKLKTNDEEWHAAVNVINEKLKMKLNTEDYNTLQIPVRNRIRALMYGFKKMKSIIHSSLYPDAAGVTKCVSCGRPAELAGSKYKPSGDGEGPADTHATPTPEKTQSLNDIPPPSSGSESEKSFISLPAQALKKSGTDASQSSTGTSPTEVDIGLHKRKTRKTIDDEFQRLVATSPKTRFCGGKHTRTSPLQKGIKLLDVEFPQQSKEQVSLVGYDKTSWYKGLVPSEQGGELPYDVDPDTVDMDEILESCCGSYAELPPRDAASPRYCGGAHTLTKPLQKGIQFSPFRLTESPLHQSIVLPGARGGMYKGLVGTDDKSAVTDSTEISEAVDSQVDQKGRKILHPNIVSLPCETQVGQIFSLKREGVSLEMPKSDLKQVKQQLRGQSECVPQTVSPSVDQRSDIAHGSQN